MWLRLQLLASGTCKTCHSLTYVNARPDIARSEGWALRAPESGAGTVAGGSAPQLVRSAAQRTLAQLEQRVAELSPCALPRGRSERRVRWRRAALVP